MVKKNKITIYTDGACRGNPGPGGWGAVLTDRGHEKTLKGFEHNTTNNRMELTAAIMALAAIKTSANVELFTDSTYVKNGITEWIAGWKAKNWQTSTRKAVKNVDLWKDLDEMSARHEVEWKWVRGHSGDIGNELADQLANEAIDEALNKV
jgi:ribonuclease HI